MRVLQLIDSLDAGGAERIAVTFANSLCGKIEASHLCTTRMEGVLKQRVNTDVGYLFLKKTASLDLGAAQRLIKYLRQHKVDIIHAHTTSFFFATLVKLLYPKISVIWHTHLGQRVYTKRGQNKVLYLCSRYFKTIIAVNENLKDWCRQTLRTKDVNYLPNFVDMSQFEDDLISKREKTIVCLANLKAPKNHQNLVTAFARISSSFPDWRLLLTGKDFHDPYSEKLHETVEKLGLKNKVVFLGQQSEVPKLLAGATIGVLASDSEGLPMALLEYGAAGLAVVTTEVGHCGAVLKDFGILVPPNNPGALADALATYLEDDTKRQADGKAFRDHIRKHYSAKAVMPQLINIYRGAIH